MKIIIIGLCPYCAFSFWRPALVLAFAKLAGGSSSWERMEPCFPSHRRQRES
jgi:hypothetical protein